MPHERSETRGAGKGPIDSPERNGEGQSPPSADRASSVKKGPAASCESGACRTVGPGIRLCQVFLVVFFLLMAIVAAQGQPLLDRPAGEGQVDIVEKLGETLPGDVPVVTSSGDTVAFAELTDGEIPTVLVFHYSDCPMLCSLVMDGVRSVANAVKYTAGEEYRILALSIDPLETVQRARQSERRYNGELREDAAPGAWQFLVAPQESIRELTDAAGFQYYFDRERDEFFHAAVATILSPERMISRYLYGIQFKPLDMRLALLEASEGRVGSATDRLLLYCMHYDPEGESYTPLARNIMKLGGGVTMFLLFGVIGIYLIRERSKKTK